MQKQPKATAVKAGRKATFSATATGTPGPVAVWETSSDGGTTWQPAGTQPATRRTDEGTYRSTLEFTADPEQDGVQVRAVFRNAHGKVTTAAVGLSVK